MWYLNIWDRTLPTTLGDGDEHAKKAKDTTTLVILLVLVVEQLLIVLLFIRRVSEYTEVIL